MAVRAVRIVGRGFRRFLLLSTACAALAVLPAPLAAATTTVAQAGAEPAMRFSVPAQSLDSALTAFADQAGFRLLFSAPAVQGLTSQGLNVTATPVDALNQLLAGSGFTWRFTGPKTVTLEKVAAAGAVLLDPVTVQGGGTGRAGAYGPVAGYVATRSAGATKTDTPLVETPQSISVVGAEELEARNVQTLEDAVKYTPGVVLSYGSVGDSRSSWYKMRGFPVTTTYYRDGLKVAGQSWQRMDSFLMERVEILRGPASVMYGQSVPGGLINMVSKRPQDVQSAEVAVEYGSNDWKRIEGDITGPLDQDKELLYRITAAVQDSNGLNGIEHDRADRKMIAPSLTWRPQQGTSVTLAAVHQVDESRGWTPRRRYTTAYGTTNSKTYMGEPDYDRFQQEQTQLTLLAEHAVSDRLKFSFGGRYAKYDLDYRQVWPGSFQADGRTMNRAQYVYGQDAENYAFDARAEGKFSVLSTDHTLLGGVDYSYLNMKDGFGSRAVETSLDLFNPVYGRYGSEPALSVSDVDSRMLGVYLQDQISVGENWVFLLGGRRDFPGVSSGVAYRNAYTGRFGVAYKTGFGLVPYASYAESFEPQSGTGWGGTRFTPTTGRQYEIGVKYEPQGTNLLATVALFDLRKQNVLTTDPDPTHLCSGSRCSVQTGEVKSQGVELGLTMELAQGLKGVAAYTYNPIEVTKSNTASEIGRQQSDQPIHTASLWLDYGVQDGPLEGFGLGGGLRFVGKTTNNSSNVTTAAYVMDEMMVRYATEAWRLSVNVRNLLDREVEYTCTKSATQSMCYLNEPLTVTARVSRKF
ncbi:TonB-dependent siderophore receptor [Azospirillum sp. HJ39]|uniref:TonB-dependent siderophore receptor n=1 Tax=Azospirillum sp. HJ39 TaxID=3159496 RepID=UPI00355882E0